MSEAPPSPLSATSADAADDILTPIPFETLPASVGIASSHRKLRVLVLSSDTGGGHRASAQALCAALEQLHPGAVHVDIVDFFVDLAGGMFSQIPEQYTYMAKRPWLWKFSYEFTKMPPGRFMSEVILNTLAYRKIRDAFIKYAPDLILSVHPLVNTLSLKILKEMRRTSGMPSVPYVTVVTDLGIAHPTWFNKRADMIYIPISRVRPIALKAGVPPQKLRQYGLPVRKDFWTAPRDKEVLRAELGLRPKIPAILVVGGGDGVGGLKAIVTQLVQRISTDLGPDQAQLVVICGKNQSLCSSLQKASWPIHLSAQGYVNNMSDWMAACDMICTKAGPGTIAESLIRGLPIILTGFLPGQEEDNVAFVTQQKVGEFAKKPKEIAEIVVRYLKDPTLLAETAQRAQALGRPQASLEIAKDLVDVACKKTQENIEIMEQQQQLRIAAGQAGTIQNPNALLDSSPESHLLFRVRFLLRVVLGSMLASRALGYDGRTPPTSPVGSSSLKSGL
eukprot:GFKZ01000473.1.p1 GENE.GFKZ01000473.1~~GFKZ01000473.1.p1  ORF type:complete len:506 (-),score=70.62 GFKZ01000473.1:1162-2679(-)